MKQIVSRFIGVGVTLAGVAVVVALPVTVRADRARMKEPEVVSIQDRVVASIDGEPISLSDLKAFWSLRAPSVGAPLPGDTATLRVITEEFVLTRLIEKEAQATGVQVSDAEMDGYLAEVLKQNRVDLTAFEKMVQARGLSIAQYKSQIRGDILRSRVTSANIRAKVAVSEGDVKKVLGDEVGSATEGIRLEEIFIPKSAEFSLAGAEDPAAAKSKAEELYQRIEGGESFRTVGSDRYLDLGRVKAEDLLPEIAEVAESLDEGETSTVIEGEKGFYLVRRLTEEEAETQAASNPMAESVKKGIQEERSKEQAEKFLKEELPKKYNVEYKV